MKLSFGRIGSASLIAVVVLTACASNDSATIDDGDASISGSNDGSAVSTGDGSNGYYPDTGSTGSDSASGGDTGGGKQCVAHCTSDTDCQNSCPPAPNNGINCCDTSSGVCFGSTASTCAPAGGGDAGSD